MPKFGMTIREVGSIFPAVKKIDATFKSDNRSGMAEFSGEFLSKVVEAFERDEPDFVLTLGDRPEMLCVATACLYLGIPTAQVHGGEKTFTVDELARHAITKLSHLHFPATSESAERIKKMGEEPWRICVVGAPALDTILNEELPSRNELFEYLKLNPKEKLILVLQHPVSEEWEAAGKQMKATLSAVKTFGLPVAAIYPHADAGGRKIIQAISRERGNPLFRIFPSISHKMFLALERESSVMVGNSSAGMVESASFKIPVVNIGARQRGRQHGKNVIHVGHGQDAIQYAINRSLNDSAYRRGLKKVVNPYGDGQASERIVKILERLKLDKRLLMKQIAY